MKKILVMLLMLLVTFSFTGCIIVINLEKDVNLHQPIENVSKIEIYKLEDGERLSCSTYSSDDEIKEINVHNFPEYMSPLKTLEAEDAVKFYDRLDKFPEVTQMLLVLAAVDPGTGFHEGYIARVVYTNGEWEAYSPHGYSTKDNANSLSHSYLDGDWAAFIEEYLDS